MTHDEMKSEVVKKSGSELETVVVPKNARYELENMRLGGSRSDLWNDIVTMQTADSFSLKKLDKKARDLQFRGLIACLIGIRPNDELEGMLAGQLIAAHNAAMECYRRAMLGEQTLEGRRENLSQASKLSRTYSLLLDALNRHRGKGQQKVTVEHVHVHSGGQAIVGSIEHPEGGDTSKMEEQSHALAYAPGAEMRCENATMERVPRTRNAKRKVPDARRKVAGCTEG